MASVPGGARIVRVARSVTQVESLRAMWATLLGDSIRTDPDYFLWSLREEPHVIRPHVLSVEQGGRTEAIVAARIVDTRLPCKLGHTTVYAPTVRAICVMHKGLLGQADPDTADAIVDELVSALDRREADVVLFRHLQRGSPLHRAVTARATFATRRQHEARTDVRWEIDLPPTLDEYLASVSSSTRKGVRRTSRGLEQRFGERLSTKVFREATDPELFFDDVEAVAARTYQRHLGVGYLGDEQQRAHLRVLATHGWFRAYILYLDGQPIAFELGAVYHGRFHSLAGAYDPAYGHHRVGHYLLLKTIEDLAAESDVSVFDFGLGDAEYKRKLGHRSAEEGDFVIYARRPRPIWISFARTALLEISRAATTALSRLALLERIKHRSRRTTKAA